MNQLKVKKIASVLVILLLFPIVMIGCNDAPNAEQATLLDIVSTSEITAEPTTEITPTLEVTTEPVTLAISKIDLKALEKDIDQLSIAISNAGDNEIQSILDTFMTETSWEVSVLYYGNQKNGFWTSPMMELPSDYKFTERPPYLNAVDTGLYIPELYSSAFENKMIQTMCKPIIVDGNIIGVVGIDVFN